MVWNNMTSQGITEQIVHITRRNKRTGFEENWVVRRMGKSEEEEKRESTFEAQQTLKRYRSTMCRSN